MISITDFKMLPFSKQCDFITVFADYLIYRTEEGIKYYLYYMESYFVEVCYVPGEHEVKEINAFKEVSQLDPYLEEISLPLSRV
ncbi:MAG: hypothetical protein R3345_04000 [Fulvivirga sp.]|nr:hypothetical protein [Fulvivirga sp.]